MGHADSVYIDLEAELGPRAAEPPSVVVPRVGRGSSSGELVRHLVSTSVGQILLNDPGVRLGDDPEAVHQYRVATRRLRSDLRTFRRTLGDPPTVLLRDELKWLGGAVGPVRDLDVLLARFTDHTRSLSDQDQPGAAAVLARMAGEREQARVVLIDSLRSERYEQLLAALVTFASHPPLAPASKHFDRPAAASAGALVRRRWKQLRDSVDAGGDDPSDDALHRIRIASKRCRYAAEAVAPVVGRPATRFAARVAAVQGVLGDHHDTVVAEAWLRTAAIELVGDRLSIGALIAIERSERTRLRAEWPAVWRRASKKKARAWF